MTSVPAAQFNTLPAQVTIAVGRPSPRIAEVAERQPRSQLDSQSSPLDDATAFIDSDLGQRARQLHKQRILIVDADETSLLASQTYLQQNGYQQILSTIDVHGALSIIGQQAPELVLLAVDSPSYSGLEILKSAAATAATRHLPIIILAQGLDSDVKQRALNLGATDFLNKPIDPFELIPRVRNALLLKSHREDFAGESARLEAMVRRRTEDLSRSRQQLILGLAKAAEHRDDDTGNHVLRVGRYAGMIAKQMGWPDARVQMLELAAQLHDVGKIGIPDSILFKPGKLDPQEWELMRKHCSFGVDIVEPVSLQDLSKLRAHARLGAEMLHVRSSPMMMMAARIAQTHHEKWDGSGYPIGLAGEDIPIEGRITAVADVFDALSSERPYKKAFPRQKCFEIIEEGRGNHFDPQIVDAFFECASKIVEVQLALMDRK